MNAAASVMNSYKAALVCLLLCCTYGAEGEEIIDLTHELNSKMPLWPDTPPFRFNILERGRFEDYWYEQNNFSTAEHGGTHLDAPSHFAEGKWRLHEIPLRNVIGPGVVIDITARAENDSDAQVEIEDILQWERTYGKLPDRAVVIMNSGWSKYWPNATAVFGTQNIKDFETFHFPGFSPRTSQWLTENRNYINAIGVDTPSTDYGQSRLFETHVIIGNASIIGLENLANVHKLPPVGSIIFAIPLKIHDGSGSPLRVFAINYQLIGSASLSNCHYLTIMGLLLFYALYSIW